MKHGKNVVKKPLNHFRPIPSDLPQLRPGPTHSCPPDLPHPLLGRGADPEERKSHFIGNESPPPGGGLGRGRTGKGDPVSNKFFRRNENLGNCFYRSGLKLF